MRATPHRRPAPEPAGQEPPARAALARELRDLHAQGAVARTQLNALLAHAIDVGWLQKDLAQVLGVSYQAIQNRLATHRLAILREQDRLARH